MQGRALNPSLPGGIGKEGWKQIVVVGAGFKPLQAEKGGNKMKQKRISRELLATLLLLTIAITASLRRRWRRQRRTIGATTPTPGSTTGTWDVSTWDNATWGP